MTYRGFLCFVDNVSAANSFVCLCPCHAVVTLMTWASDSVLRAWCGCQRQCVSERSMLYAVGCALGLAALTPMLGLCGGGPFHGELLRVGVRMGVSESGLSLFVQRH